MRPFVEARQQRSHATCLTDRLSTSQCSIRPLSHRTAARTPASGPHFHGSSGHANRLPARLVSAAIGSGQDANAPEPAAPEPAAPEPAGQSLPAEQGPRPAPAEAQAGRTGGEASPKQPITAKVRVSVRYRVHSRQMLCVGGSEMPFGWSFLSIAKVPMIWSPGDIWTAEVELPAGARIEYKYVILEEQDWTKQENVDAEGLATFSYRTEPDDPPDYLTIQKKMAIVAWQPGPNRTVQVPSDPELLSLKPGEVRSRELPRFSNKQRSEKRLPLWPWSQSERPLPDSKPDNIESEEWEVLLLNEEGVPVLQRRDQWVSSDRHPPREVKGFYF